MTRELHIGISTCPNDTFAFHALLSRELELDGVRLRFELTDVEELNRRWMQGEFDLAKLSFHAALHSSDELWVLPTGSALGSGVGPLLLARPEAQRDHPRVLCPGRWTTASLLYQLFHGGDGEVEQVVFSDIMPRLQAGTADLGVCIHEGRFTWEQQGLERVEDLGERWESETGALLPLGGIVARRSLGAELARQVATALGQSIDLARSAPKAAEVTMRKYAQELSSEVLWSHVELYVGEHTRALGEAGREALRTLATVARERDLIPADSRALEILP